MSVFVNVSVCMCVFTCGPIVYAFVRACIHTFWRQCVCIMFAAFVLYSMRQLRRFAVAYFHSHGDATGVFSQCIPGNCRIDAFQ